MHACMYEQMYVCMYACLYNMYARVNIIHYYHSMHIHTTTSIIICIHELTPWLL